MLDSKIKNFLWTGDTKKRKLVVVKWSVVGMPITNGGLGIRPLNLLNKSAMLYLGWSVLIFAEAWEPYMRTRFLWFLRAASSIWQGIKPSILVVHEQMTWQIGSGNSISFWCDKWLSRPIFEALSIPSIVRSKLLAKVSNFISHSKWIFPETM